MRRYGYVEFPKALLGRRHAADVLGTVVEEALRAAEMTEGDTFYLRLSVIELLPEDAEEETP